MLLSTSEDASVLQTYHRHRTGAAAGLLLHLCSDDVVCGKGRNRSPQCANLCKVRYWTPEGETFLRCSD